MPSARETISLGAAVAIIVGSLAGGVTSSVLRDARGTGTGSTIIQGDTYYVTQNTDVASLSNENPSVHVNSGAVATYGTSGDIPGGGLRLSASGSRNLTAFWLVPVKYQSGAALDSLSIEAHTQPIATSGSVVINCPSTKASISQCTAVRHHIRVATGTYLKVTTGTILTTKLIPGTYVGFITNASGGSPIFGGGNSPNDIVIKPVSHEKYGR